MTAILGGTMRAPLTAAFFALELTGNMHILLPLLTSSVATFTVTVLLMKRSILTERIARRGLHLSREHSVDPFLESRVGEIMVRKVETPPATMSVADAIAFYFSDVPRHRSYPVIDVKGAVLGMVSRADMFAWARDDEAQTGTLGQSLSDNAPFVGYDDEIVAALADRTIADDVSRVPILSRIDGKLVGLVARRALLQVRAHLTHQEQKRSQGFA